MHQRSWTDPHRGGRAPSASRSFGARPRGRRPGIWARPGRGHELRGQPGLATPPPLRLQRPSQASEKTAWSITPNSTPSSSSPVKAAFTPTLGKTSSTPASPPQSDRPHPLQDGHRLEYVPSSRRPPRQANAVADAAGTHTTGLAADSQLSDFTPTRATPTPGATCPPSTRSTGSARGHPSASWFTGIDPRPQGPQEEPRRFAVGGCQVNGIPNQDPSAWR